MGIVRTFACAVCNHYLEVTLAFEDWDAPPPECPRCNVAREMNQDFKPFGIGGSARARATALAEEIAATDYAVADMQVDNREGGVPTQLRYQDRTKDLLRGQVSAEAMRIAGEALRNNPRPTQPSKWGADSAAMQTAIAYGRETRLRYGNGLDVLHGMLKSGDQPDLIEMSKRRSMKVW